MKNIFTAFILYTIFVLILRFNIGVPAYSNRMQTRYKFEKIPKAVNLLLFFNTSEKPISLHIIILQIANYITFVIFIILKLSSEIKIYINCLWYTFLFVVLIPLVIETIYYYFKNELKTNDKKFIIDFKSHKLTVKQDNSNFEYHYSLFIGNKLITYDDDNNIVQKYKIDNKSKIINIID